MRPFKPKKPFRILKSLFTYLLHIFFSYDIIEKSQGKRGERIMGKNAPQLESNPFYSARKAESEKNEELSSRESASDIVLIEQTRLSKIESGKVVPYPEEVCNMARAYSAPELCNIYCSEYCEIGRGRVKKHDIASLDRVAFRVLGALQETQELRDNIISVAENGDIYPYEYRQLREIMEALDKLIVNAQSFKLWVEKNKGISTISQLDETIEREGL